MSFDRDLGLWVYDRFMRQIIARLLSVTSLLIPVVIAAQPNAVQVLNNQPLYFEENRGQLSSQVKFVARGTGNTVLISDNETTLVLGRREHAETVRLKLDGSASGSAVRGIDQLPGRVNYLIGNDPAHWHTDLRTYARVERRGVYPGIDLVYYGNERQLEYDLVVSAGADPNAIRLHFDGAERLRLNEAGDLVIETPAGELRQLRPRIYQVSGESRQPVTGEYTLLSANEVGFDLPAYDRSQTLVIDPTLVYASYLGGSGSDYANGVAVDASGNVYVTGGTTSTQFPVVSPFQSSLGGNGFYGNVFVTKISTASGMVYSTYVGGNNNDAGNGIAVDTSGNAYVAGTTSSSNFPVQNAAQPQLGGTSGQDAFVLKLAPAGNALVYSTYIGGSNNDYGSAIALDPSGNAYVTGTTYSTDFPIANAFQTTNKTSSNTTAFVVKLGPSGGKFFATYLGGSTRDAGTSIAADASGVYVTGNTGSQDFPTVNALQASNLQSYSSAFVAKFNPAGSALVFSTYLGQTNYNNSGQSLAIDPAGNIYLAGPGSPSLSSPTFTFGTDNSFIAKLVADGSALAYWVRFGTQSPVNAIAVDGQGHAYVTGNVYSSSFLTTSPFQATLNGNADAFVAKLNASGASVVYSSYLGGNGSDSGNAIAVDPQGAAYVVGTISLASNPTFPTVSPTQATPGGGYSDAFLAKITDSTPFIDSMTPVSAAAGGAAFTLTLNGSGFTSSTVATWNGSPRTTTYVSPTQIAVAITAADIASVGSASVSLVGAPPGSSLFLTFQITSSQNPIPYITSITPASAVLAGAGFTMTVVGGGFIPSSVVQWNGQNRTTTYISSGQLTAQIPGSDLSVTGTIPITVFDPSPGGGSSETVKFTININHAITSLSPTSAFAGGPGFTLTVNGLNFVNGSIVQWNGSNRVTTFVSATQLTAQISAADIPFPSGPQVTVFIPGPAGGTSAQFAFVVSGNFPTPVLVSVSPTTTISCTSGELDITGSGFVVPNSYPYYNSGSTVSINGNAAYYSSATVVDANHIKLPFNSSFFTPGTTYLTVTNPSPGGGVSNALLVAVNNPVPSISSMIPSSAAAGGAAFTLNLSPSGCSAPANAVIRWNGVSLASAISQNYYPFGPTATIPASYLANSGTAQVTLFYPPPGGGESAPVTFAINPTMAPVPSISSIFPTAAAAAGSAFSLTVNGSGFTGSSVVRVNGLNRTTTLVSTTQLKATITTADLATAGTAQITVFTPTPGGGTSSPVTFTISPQLTPAGGVSAGFTAALPGATVRVPISLTLNSGVSVDSVSFGVTVAPNGSAPSLAGSLAFEQGPAMPAPTQLDLSGAPNSMSVFWSGLTPLSGPLSLGNVVVNIPATASNGQTYQVQVLGASASLASTNVALNVGTGSISVGADYGVGDVTPSTGDAVGGFGDGQVNTLDLIAVLRAVTNLPGYRPGTCTDRFDAMDAFPADTLAARGGDGQLNTLDLIVILQRAVNLDPARPRRVSRSLSCPAGSVEPPQAMRRLPDGNAILRLELGSGSDDSSAGTPVYLVAVQSIDLAGLSFSAGSAGIGFTGATKPSLFDNGVQDTVAVGWLDSFSMHAGQRLLLGYLTGGSAPRLLGASANALSGDNIAVELGSSKMVKR
jgi:hypothetical protein